MDQEIPVFNEWDDDVQDFLIIKDTQRDQNDKNDEVPQEESPTLVDALEIVRKLQLFASIRQPELHQLITSLKSKLADAYLDSKTNKQSSVTDFFENA